MIRVRTNPRPSVTMQLPSYIRAQAAVGRDPMLSYTERLGWFVHPGDYDPEKVTREDLVHDNALRGLRFDEEELVEARELSRNNGRGRSMRANIRRYPDAYYIVEKRTGKVVDGPFSRPEGDEVLDARYTVRPWSPRTETHQLIEGRYLTEHAFERNRSHSMRRNRNDDPEDWNIANPGDAGFVSRRFVGDSPLFHMWFGAYGDTKVFVWADSFESAFEEAVEWADDEGDCGIFTTLDESDLRAVADDLGIPWPGISAFSGGIESDASRILEEAEADLTVIGHTSLKCEQELGGPAYVHSDEWGGGEVHDKELFDAVYEESLRREEEDED